MIDEIITEETAKLAKEKGFDNGCGHLWGRYDDYIGLHDVDNYNRMNNKDQYSAPTQTLLARWIREIHEIHIEIYCNASGWGYILTKLNGTTIQEIMDDVFFKSNEEALEVGLLMGLKRIKDNPIKKLMYGRTTNNI
jgi:hypothetical protein